MNIVVTAKLSNDKLLSKLVGLQNSDSISNILVVRRFPVVGDKITCISPGKFIQNNVVAYEIWRLLQLLKLLRHKDNQVVLGIQFFLHGFVSILSARITRKKSIVWLIGSDLMVHSDRPVIGRVFRRFIQRADRVLVMGNRMKDKLNYIAPNRVMEMQSFIDPKKYFIDEKTQKEWDFGFIGNLEPVKQVHIQLEALSVLEKAGEPYTLVIVGKGEEEESLKQLSKELGIEHLVTFAGYQQDVGSYLNKIKTLMLTSKSEGLPAILIEAAFCGVPSLTTKVGEIEEVFGQSEAVCFFNNDSIEEVARKMSAMYFKHSEQSAFYSGAIDFRKTYLESWSKTSMVDYWEKLIKSI